MNEFNVSLFRITLSNEERSYSIPVVATSLTKNSVREMVDTGDLRVSVQETGRCHSPLNEPAFVQEYLEEARDWVLFSNL